MEADTSFRSVLIVEDQSDLSEVLSLVLEGQNIKTEQANNGLVALELLKNKHFDAVLCDIAMPEMNGIDCLTKALSLGISAPFIFITGQTNPKFIIQAIRLGAIDFITKPFSNEEIIDVLYRVLEISVRRKNILLEISKENPDLLAKILKDERMITLMRVKSNQ